MRGLKFRVTYLYDFFSYNFNDIYDIITFPFILKFLFNFCFNLKGLLFALYYTTIPINSAEMLCP